MGASSITNIPPKIVTALKSASRATGADFDYLLKTARRESALKPGARAATSSASGLFQFIEQTWLGTLKNAGPKHGLGKISGLINQDRHGRFTIADPAKRKAVLALRFDPKLSALMAGEFTRTNARAMQMRIGRPPSEGELYIGHFLGAGQASRLINLMASRGREPADAHFPKAAKANPAIFYGTNGKARSLASVYSNLTRHYSDRIAAFGGPQSVEGANLRSAETRAAPGSGAERPLTHALFTLWRTPGSELGAGQGAGSAFHNLFLPGGAAGAVNGATAVPRSGESKPYVPSPYVPSVEAFLGAFGNQPQSAPQPPGTRTAAGRINGVWGEDRPAKGLLARRRPGAI